MWTVTLLVKMSGASTGFYMWGGKPTITTDPANTSSKTSRTTVNSSSAALR